MTDPKLSDQVIAVLILLGIPLAIFAVLAFLAFAWEGP